MNPTLFVCWCHSFCHCRGYFKTKRGS